MIRIFCALQISSNLIVRVGLSDREETMERKLVQAQSRRQKNSNVSVMAKTSRRDAWRYQFESDTLEIDRIVIYLKNSLQIPIE